MLLPDLEPTEEVREFYLYIRAYFEEWERRLKRKEAELKELEAKLSGNAS